MDPFAPKEDQFLPGMTPHLHRKRTIRALPDALRHLIIKYAFDFAIGGENWIEWDVKKRAMCCDARESRHGVVGCGRSWNQASDPTSPCHPFRGFEWSLGWD